MANIPELQEAILKALDAVVTQRNNDLKLDKTITAIVKKNVGLKYGKPIYEVEYSGGSFQAICQNAEDIYIPKTSVYVLVPEGNFSKEKIIIGRASSIVTDRSASVIAAAVNQFSVVGSNLLTQTDSNAELEFGLRSFHPMSADNKLYHSKDHRYQLIYDKYSFDQDDDTLYSQLNFDNERLQIYKDDSTAIMVRADFLTNLDTAQRQQVGARYGLIFNFIFDNLNKGYGETNGEIFENVAKDITIKENDEKKSIIQLGEEFIQKTNVDIANWVAENTGYIDVFLEQINSAYLAFKEKTPEKNTEIVNATILAYQIMVSELKNYNTVEKIKKRYNEWFDESVGDLENKVISYTWTSDDMIGNPMFFNTWNSQYQIFNLDLKAINSLENIVFFKEGFIENEEYEKQWPISEANNGGGPDIFMKNLQIYAMNPMDIQSGDYVLKVEPNTGYDVIFDTTSDTEKIQLKATLTRKIYEDISSNTKTSYLWFKEDSSVVNSSSKDYHSLGGIGWRKISEKSTSRYFTINSIDNQAYKNNYKCVAIYEPSTDDKAILSYPFVIYNKAAKIDLILESDLGTHFSYDAGAPTIRVLIQDTDNENEFVEKGYPLETEYPKYKYKWTIADNANNYTLFLDDISSGEETSENIMLSSVKQKQLDKIEKFISYNDEIIPTDVPWRATRIKYPVSISSTGFVVTCYVQKQKNANLDGEAEYVDVGSASLEFLNQAESITSDYRIQIVNGDQVFQYDEYGNTPTSEKKKNPLEILPLQVKLFTPSGVEVSGTNYQVEWIFPIENTLITVDPSILKTNPATKLVQLVKGHEIKFDIEKIYNPDAYANQITCHVAFGGKDYYKDTNFYFGKQGSNGTNGTDVVAKIEYVDSNLNKDLSILKREPLTLYLQKNLENDTINKMFNVDRVWSNTSQFFITSPGTIVENGVENNYSGLKLFLYQKNTEIEPNFYQWNIAGNPKETKNLISKYFNIDGPSGDNGKIKNTIIFDENSNKDSSLLIQNIRGKTNVGDQTYYAFYSLPIIWYENINEVNNIPNVENLVLTNRISIDKQFYLNEIIYNADGRNPIYNHNQGLKLINIPDSITKIIFTVKGGLNEIESIPSINLLENKDEKTGLLKIILHREEIEIENEDQTEIKKVWVYYEDENLEQKKTVQNIEGQEEVKYIDQPMVYILPNDTFSGSDTNNRIEATLYTEIEDEATATQNTIKVATVYAPINMTLNTFGLASLNAWDGNTVTIDEEEGYVMAPQVGAGEKDSNNRFTGVLMGKTETSTGHGENAKETGLFGYSHGLQSMFLDAKTGNAYFGLPDGYYFDPNADEPEPLSVVRINEDGTDKSYEEQAKQNYHEGRIELIPGGISKIGGWRLGRSSMYYITQAKREGTAVNDNGETVNVDLGEDYNTEATSFTYNMIETGPPYRGDYRPDERGEIVADGEGMSGPYNQYHIRDIPHTAAGILLQAGTYPYISIKGKPLEKGEIFDIEGSNNNTNNPNNTNVNKDKFNDDSDSYLKPGDSLELQLDPSTPSLFTIFRHNGSDRNEQNISGKTSTKYLKGTRTFLAGINGRGEFVANSIRNVTTTLPAYVAGDNKPETSYVTNFAVNTVPAFGDYNTYPSHIGFKMTIGDNSLGQLFLSGLGIDPQKLYLAPSIKEDDSDLLEDGSDYEKWNLAIADINDSLSKQLPPDTTLKISGGSVLNKQYDTYNTEKDTHAQKLGEYIRPLAFYGRRISLFATPNDVQDTSIKSMNISNNHFILETDVPNNNSRAQLSLGDIENTALKPATFIDLYGNSDPITFNAKKDKEGNVIKDEKGNVKIEKVHPNNKFWVNGNLESRIGRINKTNVQVLAINVSEDESEDLKPLTEFGGVFYKKFFLYDTQSSKNKPNPVNEEKTPIYVLSRDIYENLYYLWDKSNNNEDNPFINITSSLDLLYYKKTIKNEQGDRYIKEEYWPIKKNSLKYYELYRLPILAFQTIKKSVETGDTDENGNQRGNFNETITGYTYTFEIAPFIGYIAEEELKNNCYKKINNKYIKTPSLISELEADKTNYYWKIDDDFITLNDLNFQSDSPYYFIDIDPTKNILKDFEYADPIDDPVKNNYNTKYNNELKSYWKKKRKYDGYFLESEINESDNSLYIYINDEMKEYQLDWVYKKIRYGDGDKYAFLKKEDDSKNYVKFSNRYISVDDKKAFMPIPISFSEKKHSYFAGNFEAEIGESSKKRTTIKTDDNITIENENNQSINEDNQLVNDQKLDVISIKNLGKSITIDSNGRLFKLNINATKNSNDEDNPNDENDPNNENNLNDENDPKARLEFDTIGGGIGYYHPVVSVNRVDNSKILGKFVVTGSGYASTGRRQGLVLTENTFSLWGDSNGELRARDRIWLLAETTYADAANGVPFYNINNPQIVLRAGNINGINKNSSESAVELMLNSSKGNWPGVGKNNNLSYPVFAVRSTFGDIGIFPERWSTPTGDQYRENFIVRMNQSITNGLQIQGSYKGSTTKIMEQSAALVSLYTEFSINSYRVKARKGFDGNGKYITQTTDLDNDTYNKISISGGNSTLTPGTTCTISMTGPTINVKNGRISGIGQASSSTTIGLSDTIATDTEVETAISDAITDLKTWIGQNYASKDSLNGCVTEISLSGDTINYKTVNGQHHSTEPIKHPEAKSK